MADTHESLFAGDRLTESLRSELPPNTVAKLQAVIDTGITTRELLMQAVDLAFDLQASGELHHRYTSAEAQRLDIEASAPFKTPAVLPAEGTERPLTQVELGDIVRLKKPYQPVIGTDRQRGPFGFGIVAEIIHVLPDGRTRNVSLYLYDPERREIFLGPNGVPEFVDHHCSEFDLYKRASEQGYIPLVPRDQWARTPGIGGEPQPGKSRGA